MKLIKLKKGGECILLTRKLSEIQLHFYSKMNIKLKTQCIEKSISESC